MTISKCIREEDTRTARCQHLHYSHIYLKQAFPETFSVSPGNLRGFLSSYVQSLPQSFAEQLNSIVVLTEMPNAFLPRAYYVRHETSLLRYGCVLAPIVNSQREEHSPILFHILRQTPLHRETLLCCVTRRLYIFNGCGRLSARVGTIIVSSRSERSRNH